MPHVLPAEVCHDIGLRRYQVAPGLRVDLREPHVGTQRRRRVQGADALGKRERHRGKDRPQGDDGVLQRADPYRVLPAQLVGVGPPDGPVPADPVEQLHIEEMEMDGVRVHAVVGDPPDLDLAGSHDLRGGIDVVLEDEVGDCRIGEGRFEPQLGAHASVVIEGLAHLVLNGFRPHRHVAHDRAVHHLEADGAVGDSRYAPVGPRRGERGVVGGIVARLPHDNLVLGGLEHSGGRTPCKGGLQSGQGCRVVRIGRRGAACARHCDLHDGPDIGTHARRHGGDAADVGAIRRAGVVIILRDERRERRGGIVVEDQGLAGVLGEVDDDVRPFGGAQEERAAALGLREHVPDIERRGVRVPFNRLVGQHHRRGQEPALGADLDKRGTAPCRIGNAALPAVCRPLLREARRQLRGDHADFRKGGVNGRRGGGARTAAAREGDGGSDGVAAAHGIEGDSRHLPQRRAAGGQVHGSRRRGTRAVSRDGDGGGGGVARASGGDGDAAHDRAGSVELKIEEPVMGGVEDPEAVLLRLHGEGRVYGPVDHHRIQERFGAPGDVGRARNLRRLAEARHGRIAGRIVVGVCNRPLRNAKRRYRVGR